MKELDIKRFAGGIFDDEPEEPAIQYSDNPRLEINSDLKIKGTNRDLKGIDTTLTEITNKINENIYCSVYKGSGDQSLSSGVYTLVNFGYIQTDTHNGFNTNTASYTIPKSGYYIIHTQIEITFEGTRRVVCRLHVNGTAKRYGINGGLGGTTSVSLTEINYFNQGDVLTVQAKVDGVAGSIGGSNISTYFQIKNI